MIKIGDNDINRINFQTIEGETTYVNAVEVGSKTIWTTPVRLYLNMWPLEDDNDVTTGEMADSLLNQGYSFVRKSAALNPDSETGNITLTKDGNNDGYYLYCDLYYGDQVQFANRTVVITYTTTDYTTKTRYYRTNVADNSYTLNTDFEGYNLDETNYPEFSIDVNLLSCPYPPLDNPTPDVKYSSGRATVYVELKGHNIKGTGAQLTLTRGIGTSAETKKGEVVEWGEGSKTANVSATVDQGNFEQTWNYTLEVGAVTEYDENNKPILSQKSIMLQGKVKINPK